MVRYQAMLVGRSCRWLLGCLLLTLLAACNADKKDPIFGLDPVEGLTAIVISPVNPTIAVDLNQQFTATGVYANGTSLDISDKVSWSSATTAVASISNQGLAQALQPGTSVITASFGGVSADTLLTVSDVALVSIQLTPLNNTLYPGVSWQYSATGVYSDGTSQDISAAVSWASGTAEVATITNNPGDSNPAAAHGVVTGLAAGTSQISATLAGISAETTLTISNNSLSSIVVTPASTSTAVGLSRQFMATANYADGNAVDVSRSVVWASSDAAVATFNENGTANSGLATGQAAGTVQITATLAAVSGTANLAVTAATLNSIVLSPLNGGVVAGQSRQYTATGVYSDGTSENLTSLVSWTSSDNAVALPNANMTSTSGLIAGLSAGTVQIGASLAGITAETTLTVTTATLSSISVTPVNSAVALGLTRQFIATGIYSDGSTVDISNVVVWASANIQIATMNANGSVNSGLASGQAAGAVQISATLGNVSGAASLTVTNASLTSISVIPQNPTVVAGLTRQFSAIGNYSDGSTADLTSVANWTSDTVSVASMNASQALNSGLATGLSTGMTLIQASSAGVEASTTLTVTAASLVSVDVTPANATARVNETEQFTATGNYSDGSTANISSSVVWASSDTSVAVLNASGQLNSGLATAMATGEADITATQGSVQGFAVLTVSPALANNPQAPAMGELQRFVMIASQAITTTAGSAVADGDMAILDLARTAYAGFTAGPVAGQFTQLTNGVSFAPDDTTPPYVVPAPYASMVAFINQIRTDLGVAATFLAADPNPAAATQVLPAELGGLVITRGVYRNASNVVIQQGNLTLDAQGDPDSVFIFVVAGTFTTGAPGGNVVLTGGAQASNVFWRTGGATVFGSNTSFAGNVLAWQQINLGTGAEVTGRLFSVTEQVTLDANTVTNPQ
ncbi:ice-binding family protein [Rheinheimera pacifica]|uniref:ice-binding family protein n=1 Tax=Rheinheimera pacifica TaxID=173990 RepID=UPI002ED839CD